MPLRRPPCLIGASNLIATFAHSFPGFALLASGTTRAAIAIRLAGPASVARNLLQPRRVHGEGGPCEVMSDCGLGYAGQWSCWSFRLARPDPRVRPIWEIRSTK